MTIFNVMQADFRRGRIGSGMRTRQDTKAYASSVRDADNMMVLSDGRIRRRWGTLQRLALTGQARIVGWDYANGDTSQFLLAFEPAKLTIYDMTMATRATFTGQPWTIDTISFIQVSYERARMVISDETFRTKLIDFDAVAGTFSISDFAFKITESGTRMAAPFYNFAPTVKIKPSIFTSAGNSTGYATYIATASGIPGGDFDLAAGTGKIKTDADFFTAGQVGNRLRILDGEVEITAVTDARNATVKVWRDVAVRLETNPFYLRKGSKLVEVSRFDHKQKVGDVVFFAGLSPADEAPALLNKAVVQATSGTAAPAPAGGAGTYTVKRVIDEDHFEIEGAGTNPTNDALAGGADVYLYNLSWIPDFTEPVYSVPRGWPQASCHHERRMWLGGSQALPDAFFGSLFFDATNFDTGEGGPADAVAAFGIGRQSRVRHMVSAFDLLVFTDRAEFYVPGSNDTAITQETIRVVEATGHGASYTIPRRFDGGTFFVDAVGQHIRELAAQSRDQEYSAAPLTVVVPEWVAGPDETAIFSGAANEATPYMIFANSGDGSLIVMHSSRADDAFGFMRWTLDAGAFLSVAGVGNRLFAVASRGAQTWLLEFDTSEDHTTCDFAAILTASPAQTAWVSLNHADRDIQLHAGNRVFTDGYVETDGSFTTPEPVSEITIGDPMPWLLDLHTPAVVLAQGARAGKTQRIVSVDIAWDMAGGGFVEGTPILSGQDDLDFNTPVPVDEWRTYHIGKWGKEPFVRIHGDHPARVGIRSLTQNIYV